MLTKRQQRVVAILQEQKDWMVGKDIAKVLNVSDRTIRNDIAVINEFYEGDMIESHLRKGYRIVEQKQKQYVVQEEITSQIPETKEERRQCILKRLLDCNQINFYELSTWLCISEFSLESDLNYLRKQLESYPELKLIRQYNMLQLCGSERKKRLLYEELILEKLQGNLLNLNKIAENFSAFDLLKVKDILKEIFLKYHYVLNEVRIPGLLIHLGVVLERNGTYHTLKLEPVGSGTKFEEYELSKEFFKILNQRLSLYVSDDDMLDFAMYLKREKRKEPNEEQMEVLVKNLVQHIIVEIKEHFDIDFQEDTEFRLGLELHMMGLLKRHSEQVKIDNTCLLEVKRKYPLIFEMGVWVSKIMEDYLKITISENEISFIALHIGSAYERATLKRKYRCVLICPHQKAVKDLCMQKITNRFEDRLEIVECLNYFEEAQIEKQQLDLILTTQSFHHALNISTVEITMFFDYRDEEAVFSTLNQLDQLRYQNNFLFFLLNLIREDVFLVNCTETTPEEIITVMCDRLSERNYVTEAFKDGVLQRERLAATSFFHGFATPHSLTQKETLHSAISIAILKNPIKWNQYDVRIVLLLAITEENRNLLKIFFDWFNDVVYHSERFAKLLEVKDYESFVNILL